MERPKQIGLLGHAKVSVDVVDIVRLLEVTKVAKAAVPDWAIAQLHRVSEHQQASRPQNAHHLCCNAAHYIPWQLMEQIYTCHLHTATSNDSWHGFTPSHAVRMNNPISGYMLVERVLGTLHLHHAAQATSNPVNTKGKVEEWNTNCAESSQHAAF